MPRLPALLLTAAAVALAPMTAAAAATLVAHVGPNSSSATQICTPPAGLASGATTQHFSSTCGGQFGFPGEASGSAVAANGHVGAVTEASSNNGDSLVAANSSQGLYQDFLVFHSSNPNATTEDVSVNLLLDGMLQAGGNVAGAHVETTVILGSGLFALRYDLDQAGNLVGSSDFIVDGGAIGPSTNLAFHTPFVNVPLDSPVLFRLDLQTAAGASGPSSHALSDFAANSFKLPSTGAAFRLPDGVTVNAGDYLVDNRFIDPLAPTGGAGAPEPASWTLMIAGFGLAGAALRRRRHSILQGAL